MVRHAWLHAKGVTGNKGPPALGIYSVLTVLPWCMLSAAGRCWRRQQSLEQPAAAVLPQQAAGDSMRPPPEWMISDPLAICEF